MAARLLVVATLVRLMPAPTSLSRCRCDRAPLVPDPVGAVGTEGAPVEPLGLEDVTVDLVHTASAVVLRPGAVGSRGTDGLPAPPPC